MPTTTNRVESEKNDQIRKEMGHYILVGNFKLGISYIEGIAIVNSSVEEKDIKFIKSSEETIPAREKLFQKIKAKDYQIQSLILSR